MLSILVVKVMVRVYYFFVCMHKRVLDFVSCVWQRGVNCNTCLVVYCMPLFFVIFFSAQSKDYRVVVIVGANTVAEFGCMARTTDAGQEQAHLA